jgi:prepilin-type N-terminal cleavage/methylation domain-containing protein
VRGFTLIELMIAIAILAVVAILAWRGLDQIMRGRDKVASAMEDERVFAQMFDQMRIDARLAATDDEAGQPAIGVAGNRCRSCANSTCRAPRRGCRWSATGSPAGASCATHRRRSTTRTACATC